MLRMKTENRVLPEDTFSCLHPQKREFVPYPGPQKEQKQNKKNEESNKYFSLQRIMLQSNVDLGGNGVRTISRYW